MIEYVEPKMGNPIHRRLSKEAIAVLDTMFNKIDCELRPTSFQSGVEVGKIVVFNTSTETEVSLRGKRIFYHIPNTNVYINTQSSDITGEHVVAFARVKDRIENTDIFYGFRLIQKGRI